MALPSAPPAPPTSALAHVLTDLRAHLLRSLVFTLLLCAGVATLFAVLDGEWGHKLVYAFTIGLSCWAVVDLTRIGTAWATERVRARAAAGSTAGAPTDAPVTVPAGAPPAPAWRWLGYAVPGVAGLLIGPAIGLAIADALVGGRSPSLLRLDQPATRVTLVVTAMCTLLAMVVLSALERLAAARAQAEAAQRGIAEAQLRLLQSQLEPHMLFNPLANLRVLIGLDAARAQALLDHLIAFLRATLVASRRDRHPLADEFARVGDYLSLMALRMGPRLQVRLALPPALASLPVPPLLLQPLVENAIKHGLEPAVDGGRIDVGAERIGSRLRLTVRDTGVGMAQPAADGTRFGLAQVRQRLQTLYGAAGTLALRPAPDADGGVLAVVELPVADA